MRVVRRRLVSTAGAAALAVVVPLLGAAPAQASTSGPAWEVLARCGDFSHSTATLDADGFRIATRYGYRWDEQVLTRAAWVRPPAGDSVRSLLVYGLSWLVPVLREVKDEPDRARRLERIVTAVAATSTWRPDTGLAADPVWNEGAVLRREQTLNCLYELTHDRRLLPALLAAVRAAEDPARYYGPPRRLPHNHGLMSNLALVETARILHRRDIRAFALARLEAAIRGAFTSAGVSIEQSTSYHVDNIMSWAQAEAVLRADGSGEARDTARTVHGVLVRAVAALAHLTDPSGQAVRFGDGAPPATTARRPSRTTFLDRTAGVLTARWAWTSTTDYYAVRFGGPRRMHGHEDRGEVVWSARGIPVLVDPGTATYSEGAARSWTLSPISHSSAYVVGGHFAPRAPVALVRWARTRTADSLTLRGASYGRTQTRTVVADPVRHALTLTDSVVSGRMVQVLQLDPRWRPVSVKAHALVCVDGAGHRLVVTTTGTVSSVRRGRAGLDGGWIFRYPPAVRVPAARVLVSGGAAVRTVLRVS